MRPGYARALAHLASGEDRPRGRASYPGFSKEIRLMNNKLIRRGFVIALCVAVGLMPVATGAQDRLKAMPGYEQYQKMSREIPGSVKLASLAVKWLEGGKAFEYQRDGKTFRYDIAARAAAEAQPSSDGETTQPNRFGGRGGRGG